MPVHEIGRYLASVRAKSHDVYIAVLVYGQATCDRRSFV